MKDNCEYDGLKYSYPVNGGPCEQCGIEQPCMQWDGRMLCYDCWHGAREQTQCYRAQRMFQEGWPEECRGYTMPSACSKTEAEKLARHLTEQEPGIEWIAVPWPNWEGGRLAHPGYNFEKNRFVAAYLRAVSRGDDAAADAAHRKIYPELYQQGSRLALHRGRG